MKEAQVKNIVRKLLARLSAEIYYFMPIPWGRRGVLDFTVCYRGRFIAIECKGENGRLSPLQVRELVLVEQAGGLTLVVGPDNLDEVKNLFDLS